MTKDAVRGWERWRAARWLVFALPLLLTHSVDAKNLECIGGDCGGPGHAVYRSSDPGEEEWKAVCGPWKTDFIVLNDNRTQQREARYLEHCPNATVVYARSQEIFESFDTDFLAFFDQVIERARAEGRKVLFHCKLGTHRTGRLAAYYELKFEGWPLDRVMQDFKQHVPVATKYYGFVLNDRVQKQIQGIAAFLEDPSTCQARARDCVVVTSPTAPKDPTLLAAAQRLRKE